MTDKESGPLPASMITETVSPREGGDETVRCVALCDPECLRAARISHTGLGSSRLIIL
jgi:hypothetical protein